MIRRYNLERSDNAPKVGLHGEAVEDASGSFDIITGFPTTSAIISAADVLANTGNNDMVVQEGEHVFSEDGTLNLSVQPSQAILVSQVELIFSRGGYMTQYSIGAELGNSSFSLDADSEVASPLHVLKNTSLVLNPGDSLNIMADVGESTKSSSSSIEIVNGLVAYYDFDERSGTTAHDVFGNHAEFLSGTPTWVTGKFNNGVRNLDSVGFQTTDSIDHTGDWSWSWWVMPDFSGNITPSTTVSALTSNCFVSIGASGGSTTYDYPGGGGGAFGTTSNKRLVVITYNASDQTLTGYVDNTPLFSTNVPMSFNEKLVITPGYGMDEFAVWDHVLTTAQRTYLYNASSGINLENELGMSSSSSPATSSMSSSSSSYQDLYDDLCSNLTAYWKMNESSGTVAYDSAGSNDATDVGAPTWSSGLFGNKAADAFFTSANSVNRNGDFSFSWWCFPDVGGLFDATGPLFGGKYVRVVGDGIGTNTRILYNGTSASSATIADGSPATPRHVVATYKNSTSNLKVYLDGALQLNITTNMTGNSTIQLETSSYGMDEVAFWNTKELTASQVTLLYNGGSGLELLEGMSSSSVSSDSSEFSSSLSSSSSGDYGNTWTAVATVDQWVDIDVSEDGQYMLACRDGRKFISDDYGASFNATGPTLAGHSSVAMSRSGQYQGAVRSGFGRIYRSDDYGASWATAEYNTADYTDIAISGNGVYFLASANGSSLWISNDYGTEGTWSETATVRDWSAVAVSYDGSVMVGASNPDGLFVSTDFGASWTNVYPSKAWNSVSISNDGQVIVASADYDGIYKSTNGGSTWTQVINNALNHWVDVDISGDGKFQIACAFDPDQDRLYVSDDYGVTWNPQETSRPWSAVAVSGNGQLLAATPYNANIYISENYDAESDSSFVTSVSSQSSSSSISSSSSSHSSSSLNSSSSSSSSLNSSSSSSRSSSSSSESSSSTSSFSSSSEGLPRVTYKIYYMPLNLLDTISSSTHVEITAFNEDGFTVEYENAPAPCTLRLSYMAV